MKNLKKLLAVVIVAAMMITTMLPAMAAKIENAAEANALHALGLYQGTSTTGFEPALDQPLTREQGAAMLIRLLGEEALAKALSSSDVSATLVIFSDVDAISDWARPYVAYGVRESLIAGNANGTFNPQGPLLGKDFATMILRALGYTVNASTYEAAAAELAKAGGLDMGTAVVVNNKELTRDDMVGMAYQSLQAKYKGTDETVIGRLVKNGVVSEADAISNGVYNGELAKAAEAAVSAYEAAPITTLEEIEASASALAAANAAVAKIVVEADKAAFQARIDAKLAAAEANKAAILAADEAAKQAIENAKAAVEAYENAADTTAAEVESAKALKAAADEAVAAVKDEAIKADFEARVAARAAELEALAVEYKAQADAEAAVAAYENAPFATLEQIAAAKALEAAAVEKIAAVKDATVKAALETKVAAQKALVTANEIKISPADVSVSMTNLKNIVATFSKAIDKKTVTETTVRVDVEDDVIKFDNKSSSSKVSRFILSEDGKTLIISLGDLLVNQGDEIKVTFDGFKDVDGVEMPKFEQQFVARDKADPVLERVEYVNQSLIRLYFSEPVYLDTTDEGYVYSDYEGSERKVTLLLDGRAEYIEFTSIPEENVVEAKFLNAISEGQHTIEVRDVADFAGYRMDEVIYSFNAAKDSTAPYVVAVEFLAANKIKVIYNEKINAHGISAINQVSDSTNFFDGAVVEYVDNDTAVIVTFAEGKKFDVRATVGFTVTYKSARDLAGNASSSSGKSFEGKAIDDTIAPDVVSVKVIEDNAIRVVFTEDIDSSLFSSFKIYKTDGKTLLASAADRIEKVEDIDHAYDITFDMFDDLSAGDYVFKIVDLKDVSIRANKMGEKSITITLTDTSKPIVLAAVYDWDLDNDGKDEGDDYIYVTFSKAMDYETVSDIKNYFIRKEDGTLQDLNSYKVNGEKAKITSVANGGRKVTIKLPYASTEFSSDIYLCVVGIKDTIGNYVQNAVLGSTSVPIKSSYDPFDSSVVTVAATGRNTIEITINKNAPYAFSSANNKAFIFVDAYGDDDDYAKVGVRAAAISSDGKKITLTTAYALSYDATADLEAGGNKKIRLILDSNSKYVVKDGNGVAIDLDLPVLDMITPSQKDGDRDAGGAYDSKNKTWKLGNVVTVNFQEKIDYAQAGKGIDSETLKGALTGSIEIIGPDGKALTPLIDYEAWVEGGAVKIRILKEYDKLVTLTYEFKKPELLKDADGPEGFVGVSVSGAKNIKNVITKAPGDDWDQQ